VETYRELEVEIPEELLALKSAVHQFARDVMRPNGRKLDRFHDPKDTIAPDSPLREVLRAAYGLGYHTASLPERVGGLGLRGLAMHIMLEEMGWGSADLAISIAVTSFPFSSASMSGKPDLIEEFVKPFVRDTSGSMIGCWAITEPDHGTDQLAVGTSQFKDPKITGQVTARLDGDVYIINGQKSAWVSNGTIATHAALFLNLDSSRGMAGGGIAFVPLNLPGVSKGKPLDKLGQRALNQGEIFFDQVRLPRRLMLIDSTFYEVAMRRTLTFANSAMAAVFTGLARAAYEQALEYTTQRIQGGKPISQHQVVQKRLFEMFTKVETCRALSRAVLAYNHKGKDPSAEHAIAAKTYCTQAAFEVASDALQLHGGNGLTREYQIEKLFRDARASLIEDGCNNALSVIGAQHILSKLNS
jgi:alkylation response protein AidB-like acyl-CoA dehydrogenase